MNNRDRALLDSIRAETGVVNPILETGQSVPAAHILLCRTLAMYASARLSRFLARLRLINRNLKSACREIIALSSRIESCIVASAPVDAVAVECREASTSLDSTEKDPLSVLISVDAYAEDYREVLPPLDSTEKDPLVGIVQYCSYCSSVLHNSICKSQFTDPRDAQTTLKRQEPVYEFIREILSGKVPFVIAGPESLGTFRTFVEDYDGFMEKVHENNMILAQQRARSLMSTLNPVEGRDLDRQQLASVAMDVSSRLVVAGAGTGKTTTIVGLVKYLLSTGTDPSDILLLSYTKASVSELGERITKETGQEVDCKTFHRLGMDILRQSMEHPPAVSRILVEEFIGQSINTLLELPDYRRAMNVYLWNFNGLSGNADSIREIFEKQDVHHTLKGEEVKSKGEKAIADYLFLNGFRYVYEDRYKYDTEDGIHANYCPDFHIADTDVYIEYFGVDRNGNVNPAMLEEDPEAGRKYAEGMQWKRALHTEKGTVMIETFAYEYAEGILEKVLGERLEAAGVVPSDDVSNLFSDLSEREDPRVQAAISDMMSSLVILKETGKPFEDAYPSSDDADKAQKLKFLKDVLKPVYDMYQAELSKHNEVDFSDMLNLATKQVASGEYRHRYSFVIVDEYQDISACRYRLLKAMRDSRDFGLFCVGDDWQSIYRFNGSEIDYILDFERYWGPSEICRIERTYRFSGEILERSSYFVCLNPRQIRKDLVGSGEGGRVILLNGYAGTDCVSRIEHMLRALPEGVHVLFLGRYRHDVSRLSEICTWSAPPGSQVYTVRYPGRPDLDMVFRTIHGSKGLQSDYVFILNNCEGPYSFPSRRPEPIILSMLMARPDNDLEEERRLMYVALTRAKKAVFVVSTKGSESVFVKELFPDLDDFESKPCPVCGGRMIFIEGKFGEDFLGCENYYATGCRYRRRMPKFD